MDEDLSFTDMQPRALGARHLQPAGLQHHRSHVGTGWGPDGKQSVVVLDDNALARVSAAFAAGTVAQLLQEEADIAPRLGDGSN